MGLEHKLDEQGGQYIEYKNYYFSQTAICGMCLAKFTVTRELTGIREAILVSTTMASEAMEKFIKHNKKAHRGKATYTIEPETEMF